jgi:hypothetical protein
VHNGICLRFTGRALLGRFAQAHVTLLDHLTCDCRYWQIQPVT